MKQTTSNRWIYLAGLLLVAATGHVGSQDLDVTFGPLIKRYPNRNLIFFNPSLQKGYLANLHKKFTVTPVDKYINLSGPAIPVKTEIFDDTEHTEVQGFYTIHEKNFLIYSRFDSERKSLTLYEQELSPDMALLGSPARMTEFSDITPFPRRLRFYPEAVFIAKSRSQQQIVFVKERDSSRLEIRAASPGKGELWSKVFQLDRDFKYFNVNTIKVAENGTVYILGSHYKFGCFFCPGWTEIPFLLAYSPTSKAYALHALKFRDQQNMGCMLKLMDNDIPLVAGPCGKEGDDGYCIYKVNPDSLDVEMFASQPIAKSYKVVFNEATLSLKDISVGDMVQTGNGNIVLTIQARGVYPINVASLDNFSIPIYVSSIDRHGVEKWNTTIGRHEATGMVSDEINHFLFYKRDKTYVLYNDNIASFALALTEKQHRKWLTNKTYAAAAEIDSTGKARKRYLISSDKKQRTELLFYRSGAIDDHLFHFLFRINGVYQFATLRINE